MTKHLLNCSIHVAAAALCLGAMIDRRSPAPSHADVRRAIMLIEERENTNVISAERLSDAMATMMNARMICYDGHVVDALAIYDSVARSLTPSNLSKACRPIDNRSDAVMRLRKG